MLNLRKKLEKVINIYTLINFVGTILIMVLNCADVFMSKVFQRPITGAYEITQILMLCTVIASYAYGQVRHTHINMGLFIGKFPKKPRYIISGILMLLSVAIAIILGVAACQQAASAISKNTVTGALFIPWWPFYYLQGLSMFILAVVLLYDAIMMFAAVGGDNEIEKYVDGIFS